MSSDSTKRAERLTLRPRELAEALGVDDRTIRRWQRDEGLPYARIGAVVLFPVSDVLAWLADRVEGKRRAEALAAEILEGF